MQDVTMSEFKELLKKDIGINTKDKSFEKACAIIDRVGDDLDFRTAILMIIATCRITKPMEF